MQKTTGQIRVRQGNDRSWVSVWGYARKIGPFETLAHRSYRSDSPYLDQHNWTVSLLSKGAAIATGKTRKEAIRAAYAKVRKIGVKHLKKMIEHSP